jgi:hypothetical protein
VGKVRRRAVLFRPLPRDTLYDVIAMQYSHPLEKRQVSKNVSNHMDQINPTRDRVFSALQNIANTRHVLSSKRPLNAVFLSAQKRHFCTQEPKSVDVSDIEFTVLPDIAEVLQQRSHYDVCVLSCHNEGEEKILFNLRRNNLAGLYFVWMWDNHHHHVTNLRTAMLADVVFSSHWHDHQYLNFPITLCGPHIPLHSRQWSARLISQIYPDGLPISRADGIFGGFGHYRGLSKRNAFIEQLMTQCPGHALSLVNVESYYQVPVKDRLAAWMNHKVHLIVPVARDLSSRLFEALMTGQIPLVPDDVPDLDRVVPTDLQQSLPILRWRHDSTESVQAAWRHGVERFDSEGAVGVARRHAFAREHHSLTARFQSFAAFVRKPVQIALQTDGGWVSWAQSGSVA